MSGRGAELHGGRFNPKGMPALYLSVSVMTALREANQVGNLQPTTLVAYGADIDMLFDTSDAAALAAHGMTPESLAANSWRDEMMKGGHSATQIFAQRLAQAGHNGLLVRSFAPGAQPDEVNIVLWRWSDQAPSRLVLIDDEGRLSR